MEGCFHSLEADCIVYEIHWRGDREGQDKNIASSPYISVGLENLNGNSPRER